MLTVGSEVEGYRIEGLLGRGGMGEVYEATQLGLHRTVALKVVTIQLGVDEATLLERFRREGRLQATLEHPNVVTVYEAGELDHGLFLAMRLIRGPNLKQVIAGRELETERAMRLLRPVAGALDSAHAIGLIHRDVKPQNILVGPGDHPYLADFGLTRGAQESGLTHSGQFVGTVGYVSPEQIHGEPGGPRSDVYALTAVLFECLTGSVPYPRDSEAAILYAHVSEPPPSVLEYRPDLPPALDDVIAWGMAKHPDDRPASASELVDSAAEALAELSGSMQSRVPASAGAAAATRPAMAHTRDGPRTRTAARPGAASRAATATLPARRSRRLIAAVAAIVALGALAFLLGRSGERARTGEPFSVSASRGDISLGAPAGWTRPPADATPEIPGLGLAHVVALAPPDREASGVVAGTTRANGSGLLPAGLRSRVAGDLPKPAAVRLGELEALRYRDLRVRGFDRPVTLFAAPTTIGVATIACYAPPSAAVTFASDCERVAQTLSLTRGRGFSLGTDASTRRRLEKLVRDLSSSLRSGRARLARAATAGGQAKAAEMVAREYAGAADGMSNLEVSPALSGTMSATARSLRAAADAYLRLARAARNSDVSGYAAARRAVRAAEKRVQRRLAALETRA